MPQFQVFIFTAYTFNPLSGELSLQYSLDNQIRFEEKVWFDLSGANLQTVDQEALNQAFLNLHLIAGISYYKTYCPRKLVVQSGELSEEQIKFWEKLYKFGLGEFFYKNKIDFRELVKFESSPSVFPFLGLSRLQQQEGIKGGNSSFNLTCKTPQPPLLRGAKKEKLKGGKKENSREAKRSRALVPIGGGKDSIVTAELLKKAGFDFTLFSLGDSAPQKETADLIDKERIIVRRELSPNLFELNKQGAYNGHIPISAYIAFLTIATAILFNYDYVILSNEHSANYGNLDYLGLNVNHQYSKSLEFEQDLNRYLHKYITPQVRYFSLLRPFYELKIAEVFSHYPQYFQAFTSCNKNFKILKEVPLEKGDIGGLKPQKDQNPPTPLVKGGLEGNIKGGFKKNVKWCCNCPKCVFVFTILAPFLPKKVLLEIFGKNLFAEQQLQPLFHELLGVGKNKPFECVGTAEEVAVAFYLVAQRPEFADDAMVKIFQQEILPQIPEIEKFKTKVLATYLKDSFVPEEFRESLK